MIKLKHLASEVRDIKKFKESAGLPFIGLEHIQSQTGNLTVNHDMVPTGLVSRFGPGHVLFGKLRPYLAKVAIPEFEGMCSTEAIVMEPNSHCDPRFLRYVLLSKPILDEINLSTYGARMPRTSWEFVGNRKIPRTPIEIQKRIADFLDGKTAGIDQLIRKKERINKLVHEKIDAEIMLAMTDIAMANGQPLHRVAKVVTGGTPSRGISDNFSLTDGLPWATPADLGFFEPVRATRERLTPQGTSGQVVVPAGTTLVSGIGTIGKTGITGVEMSFNQQIHAVIPYSKMLLGRFVFYVVWSKKDELASLASNTTLPIINAERFSRIRIPIPESAQQKKVVAFLDNKIRTLNIFRDKLERSITKLRELRSALVTAAVTDQINPNTLGWTERSIDGIKANAVQA